MKKIILLIVLVLFVSCSKNYIKEIEPNNKKYNAMSIDIPVNIKGKLSGESDTDMFKIYLNGPDMCDIKIFVEGNNRVNFSIENNNKLLKNVIFKSNITLKNLSFEQGVVLLKLNKYLNYPDTVKYKLSIVKNSSKQNETEQEPNDSLVTANSINITNGYIVGYYSSSYNYDTINNSFIPESDWFKFTVPESNKIMSVEITGVPNIDSVFELYDSLGVLLQRVDSNGIDAPEILKNFTVKKPSIFYLKVYAKNKNINTSIPYQIFLKLTKCEKNFELEPNDIINNANTISNSIRGYINPAGDKDVFNLPIDKPCRLNISITPLENIDSSIMIYDGSYNLIKVINYFPVNLPEVYPDLYLDIGNYYIVVSAASNMQNYRDFYTLKVVLNYDVDNWEREDNNNFNSATKIKLNKKYKGFLAPIGDIDIYKFDVTKQETLKFVVTKVPYINFILSIYNNDKKLIKEIDTNVYGEGETGIIELSAGTYYVILKSADNKYNFNIYYIMMILER